MFADTSNWSNVAMSMLYAVDKVVQLYFTNSVTINTMAEKLFSFLQILFFEAQ